MARRRKRSRGLGLAPKDHADLAKGSVDKAWRHLENMPPTCVGGIRMASSALAEAERAKAHLWSIEPSSARAKHSKLMGDANRASKAAYDTIDFFRHTCDVRGPHRVPYFKRNRRR